jgi:small subunit ribosomal protein S4
MVADHLKREEHNTMARYIGPKNKIYRKFREPLFGKEKYYRQFIKKRRTGKKSEYSIQLFEKQKLKFIYGILEKQCKKMFYIASKSKGVTGEVILQLLESRLDNIVYRIGFAVSRLAARQLVSHGHIMVNYKKINIPSYLVKPGDTISSKTKYSIKIKENFIINNFTVEWIVFNFTNMCGIFKYIPEINQIPENINEKLIVQWYYKYSK